MDTVDLYVTFFVHPEKSDTQSDSSHAVNSSEVTVLRGRGETVCDEKPSEAVCTKISNVPLSREKLISVQKADSEQAPLIEIVLSGEPQGYFFDDGILMRKWMPHNSSDE